MPHFFTVSEIQKLCQRYGFNPAKQYGQNYLLHIAPIEQMIAVADIQKNEIVVEVGPGFGVLTLALAEAAQQVLAFEIEKKLLPYWQEEIKIFPNIRLVWGNVLYQFTSVAAGLSKYKVVANLPYQITSAVLKLFLEEAPTPPESMVLLVQKEVAARICARPGNMSVLAVAVQFFGTPAIIAPVPRHLFYPEPQVDSAIIKIDKICRNPYNNQRGNFAVADFFKFVRAGFVNRRKLLLKNLQTPALSATPEKINSVWKELGWQHNRRAQELSVDEWIQLFTSWCN